MDTVSLWSSYMPQTTTAAASALVPYGVSSRVRTDRGLLMSRHTGPLARQCSQGQEYLLERKGVFWTDALFFVAAPSPFPLCFSPQCVYGRGHGGLYHDGRWNTPGFNSPLITLLYKTGLSTTAVPDISILSVALLMSLASSVFFLCSPYLLSLCLDSCGVSCCPACFSVFILPVSLYIHCAPRHSWYSLPQCQPAICLLHCSFLHC